MYTHVAVEHMGTANAPMCAPVVQAYHTRLVGCRLLEVLVVFILWLWSQAQNWRVVFVLDPCAFLCNLIGTLRWGVIERFAGS